MNREVKRTLIFAGAAVVLVLAAILTTPRPRAAEIFAEQGQAFSPTFTDALKAAAIEVVEYDEAAGKAVPFKVQVVNGRWSIPSHHNYPADGKDRLAKAASSLISLKKDRVQSDNAKDHEDLGVVDPLDDKAKGTKGRGRRVRLMDASGQILTDLIFGKEAGEGRRYVRIPDQKRTYAALAQVDASTKFEDWVETDLLQLAATAVRKITIDKYSFDEQSGTLKDRATQFLSRESSTAEWKLGELKETEEINSDTLNQLTTTLDDLRLAGVRPKHPVVAYAKDLAELEKMPRDALMALRFELAQRGFFIFKEANRFMVISNEGETQVSCDDGVTYQLRFGEVLVGTGEEITAGKEPKQDEKKVEKKDEKKGGSENRYLFVSASYDESLLGPPPAEPKPYAADPNKKPEEQKADEEKAKQEKEEYERKKKEHEQKKADGKKRAEKLSARFAEFYYVISADAFKKLRVDRTQLVKKKEAPKEEKKEEKKDEHKDHDHEKKPGEKKPEEKKPEDKKKEEKKPEEKKTEDKKQEEKKP